MKLHYFAILALIFAVSCTNSAKNSTDATDSKDVAQGEGLKLQVDSAASIINWKGFKPAGSHHGTLAIKSGELTIEGTQLKSGSFVIDMNKIINADLPDQATKDQLTGHLKSADFFDVATYPLGTFNITGVEELTNDSVSHRISGNLKLKGVEKNISFDAKITKEGDNYKAVSVPFTINRTQWGVNYASKNIFKDIKDKVIDDNMEIQIVIVAKVAQ